MSLMCHWTPRISKYLEISRIKLSLRVRVFAKPVHNRDAMMDVIQDVVSISFVYFHFCSIMRSDMLGSLTWTADVPLRSGEFPR